MTDNYRQEDNIKQEQQEIQRMAQTVTQVVVKIPTDVNRWADNAAYEHEHEHDIERTWR